MPTAVADKRDAVARATDPSGRLVRTARIDNRAVTRTDDGAIGFRGEAIVFEATWSYRHHPQRLPRNPVAQLRK